MSRQSRRWDARNSASPVVLPPKDGTGAQVWVRIAFYDMFYQDWKLLVHGQQIRNFIICMLMIVD